MFPESMDFIVKTLLVCARPGLKGTVQRCQGRRVAFPTRRGSVKQIVSVVALEKKSWTVLGSLRRPPENYLLSCLLRIS